MSDGRPQVVVVMGVSGCGRSTVAALLAERHGWRSAEAADFHGAANVARMAGGAALTTRTAPWLASLRDWIDAEDTPAVLTCSALEHAYRDVLRSSRARVRLVHLDGAARLVAGRRDRPGGHFMPAALLGSQLETLEPLRADEDGVVIDVTAGPDVLPGRALAALDLSGRTNRTELLCPR